jgi:hypothetical protein
MQLSPIKNSNHHDKHAYTGQTEWFYTSKSPVGTALKDNGTHPRVLLEL